MENAARFCYGLESKRLRSGRKKATRHAGGDKELYKRNHLSDNIEVLKLLCQKGKVIPWLNRETV